MGEVRGRILIVDNEEGFYRPLVRGLALEGFEVAAAGSGPEAMALAEREPPDLVILELALPGMDGFETLRRLREKVKNIKAVVLTAGGTPQHLREAKALGVQEFLGKPFDPARLVRLVAEEVEGREVRLAG